MKFTIRPANRSDNVKIRRLVRSTKNNNPFGLDWRQFVVAVTSEGEIIGCGQVKNHSGGSRELASIAVDTDYRSEGIASTIIRHLVQINPKPVYLICKSTLDEFYRKFGFEPIKSEEMPVYFQRINAITNLFLITTRRSYRLLVMRLSE